MENERPINVGNTLFILGAADPEMNLIETLLSRAGFMYCHAMHSGERVIPSNAYRANHLSPIQSSTVRSQGLDGLHIVTVECEVKGILPYYHIDHHRPGDRGFGMPPERFFEGSSIGQLYTLLTKDYGVQPELYEDILWEIKLAAAADHCLGHAYAGLCPGINPGELALWRAITRAEHQKVQPREIIERVTQAKKEIAQLPTVTIGDWTFRDAGRKKIRELPEASAQLGIPVQYEMDERDGRVKVGILGGCADLIQTWMDHHSDHLEDVYGDPERGYAGGYKRAQKAVG